MRLLIFLTLTVLVSSCKSLSVPKIVESESDCFQASNAFENGEIYSYLAICVTDKTAWRRVYFLNNVDGSYLSATCYGTGAVEERTKEYFAVNFSEGLCDHGKILIPELEVCSFRGDREIECVTENGGSNVLTKVKNYID